MTVVLRTIPETRHWVQTERASNRTLALVPTMGSFHEGHLSLIRRARQSCDRTIVSIFVNPLQFGPGEDYESYPRDFDRDLSLATQEGVDAVFHPAAEEMYPSGLVTSMRVSIGVGKLGEALCGASRPGHFQGVATIVAKLFHIVQPDRAFFGQKDAQQALIVRTMALDLNWPLQSEVCPTVREADGVAYSSRNRCLSKEERSRATVLYHSLRLAESLIQSGERNAASVEQQMQKQIQKMIRAVPGDEIDYARVVDPATLEGLQQIRGEVLAAVAVRFGKTRLIDNLIIAPETRGKG